MLDELLRAGRAGLLAELLRASSPAKAHVRPHRSRSNVKLARSSASRPPPCPRGGGGCGGWPWRGSSRRAAAMEGPGEEEREEEEEDHGQILGGRIGLQVGLSSC